MNNRTNYIGVGEGGGIYVEAGTVTIDHCLVAGNQSIGSRGGGIDCDQGNAVITNCTIQGNTANFGAGIYLRSSTSTITNTIVEGSTGHGIYLSLSSGTSISYSDFYNNSAGHFVGTRPTGLGVISAVNAKGDSCDRYNNIYLAPQFADPIAMDFTLRSGSPCIDAGDPASPRDPDGTIADMGAFYYPQIVTIPLTVTLTPHNPPVQIAASGGSFTFDAGVENTSQAPITFDAWTEVILPSGNITGPLVLRSGLSIPAGARISRELTQFVPGSAPAGNYAYVGKVGAYPGTVVDSSFFNLVKMPGEGVVAHHRGWELLGWDDWMNESFSPQSVGLLNASPNPFNASTALSFKLQASNDMKLAIYDIAGREVAVLAEGFYPAGTHRAVWDASTMASGVYFARLQAENEVQTHKLLLLK